MVLARGWTGLEATALQDATRLSVREFANLLDVEPRTVANWRKGRHTVKPRPFTQGLLDAALDRADDRTRERFDQLLRGEQGTGAELAVLGIVGPPEVQWLARGLQLDPELRTWIGMNRRQLMQMFSGVGLLPVVAAVLSGLDGEEQQRVRDVLVDPSRVSERVVDDIEKALAVLLSQNDVFGPQAVLPMVQGQRSLALALVRECPESLKSRLYNLHGALSQLAGWMQFDLHDFDGAYGSYREARNSAHEARNGDLAALVLCNMSYLETWRGEPRLGIDHAVAAQNWARKSSDHRLRAYADDMAAMAYAKDDQRTDCLAALAAADESISAALDQSAETSVAYFQGPGLVASLRSDCLHQLRAGRDAQRAAEEALSLIDGPFVRNRALAYLDLANAHADIGDVEQAVDAIRESAQLARSCNSDRLTDKIRNSRGELNPWGNVPCIRELDDELETYGLVSSDT